MKIFKKFFSGNTLYYPGCLSKFVQKEIVENYKKILECEGIDFLMLKDKELCCGSPVKNAGANENFKKIAGKNAKILANHGITKIITHCPSCALVFGKNYREILGDDWKIEVFHVTQVIEESLKFLKKIDAGTVATYHDSCHLGRGLGIFDKPRKIIKKAGYELVEMDLVRENSFCCGGGGGVNSNNEQLANKITIDRMEQAKKTKARFAITACPMCHAQLKAQMGKNDMKVLELSQLFEF